MNTCHECGSEITGSDVFCPFCGISLQPVVEPDLIPEPDAIQEDELASTIMMPPEEVARLNQDLRSGADAIGELAAASSATQDATPEVEPVTANETKPEAELEAPTPELISDFMSTGSGNVPARSTKEYDAGEIVEEVAPVVSIGLTQFEEPRAAEVVPTGEVAANEPEVIEIVDEIIVAEPENIEVSEELREELIERFDRSEEPDSTENSIPEVAIVDKEPVSDSEIGRPQLDLPEHDPFAAGSMFDSVRIMEEHFTDLQDGVDTRLGVPGQFSQDSSQKEEVEAQAEAKSEVSETISHTAPNIGETDTDGRRSAKLKPLSEGTILNGRYEIIRKIGGGGMGAVYLASDNNLGGVLRAVKEMIQAHIEDEQQEKAINDFRRESMILSTLDHPSIPTIFDYFFDETESRFYLVMKYISGGDLSSRLRSAPEGKIDEETVTEWAIQIADVLDYLHNQPSTIVYRDLKPSNIMVDGNSGRVMLIDFGIARSISQREEKGVTAVGTMGYAPPELFSGNVEPRSDIYSLGSTMFHLMTGADPQSNPLLIFDFQKNPRPRQINPRLSDQMERILMQAVEYSSDSRFTSAAAVRKVLEDHLANLRAGNVTYGVSEIPAAVSLADQSVFCGFCGQRIVATDLFCAFCGAKQPIAQPGVHSGAYPKAAPTAKLFVEGTGELSTPTFSLQKDEILVGRRDPMSNIFPEVDLSKYDPQTKISRRHARIWRDGSNFLVEDLGSSNGTVLSTSFKEGFRLVPHRPHPLTSGDKIRIGDTTLSFLIG